MTDRASIFEHIRVGLEGSGSPGTAVPATIDLQALGIEMQPKAKIKKFRPHGSKYPTVTAMGKEWSESKLDGQPTYNEMLYLLASVITDPGTPGTPIGATNTRLWTFTASATEADAPRTLSVEGGSSLRAQKFAYGLVNELTIGFSRDELTLGGNMLGRKITDDITLSAPYNAKYTLTADNPGPPTAGNFTLTVGANTTGNIAHNATAATVQSALEGLLSVGAGNVTVTRTVGSGVQTLSTAGNVYTVEFVGDLAEQPVTLTGTFSGLTAAASIDLASIVTGIALVALDIVPILPEHFSIYVDTTAGAIGTNKLSRWLKGEFRIRGRFSPLWVLDADEESFAAHIEVEPTVQLMVTLQADDEGMAFLTAMRASTRNYVRVEGIGDEVETNFNYEFVLDMAVQVADEISYKDEQGVYAVDVVLTIMADNDLGFPFEVRVQNGVTSL